MLAVAVWITGCSDSPKDSKNQGFPTGPSLAKGGSIGVNLDQWANGKTPPTGESWQNGNLNGNNSAYAEGKAIPFRLAVEGLTAGTTHFITIQYDFTAGGHKAYDFLASIDATEPHALEQICAGGGGARSTLCGTSTAAMPGSVTPNTFAFSPDGFSVDAHTVDAAILNDGAPRSLTIFGGTITSISTVSHAGPTDGNSTGEMLVTFTAAGPAVLLAWSGHLARSVFWNGPGDADGAGQVSGAPWHMRTLNLDGGGGANQDRSIQPSALVPPPVLTLTKVADATSLSAGSQIGFTITVANTGSGGATNVVLTDVLPSGGALSWTESPDVTACSITSGTLTCNFGALAAAASVSVHVVSPTSPANCGTINNTATVTLDNGPSPSPANASVDVLCPSLSIVKTPNAGSVNPGGTATFTITVSNAGPGAAFNVQILDTLPSVAPNHWTDDQASCSVTSIAVPVGPTPRDSLFCGVGTLASGASFTVHVSATIPLGFTVNPPSPGSAADAIEIDGNLVDSPAGGPKDWQTLGIVCPPNVNATGCAVDITPVANDNAFGEGTKEDDITPQVVTGSIPPNKSDLIRFYTASERFGTHNFLYLAWIRINSPQGTTNMDFELNKGSAVDVNGIPIRTAGDVLIKYDLSQGGTNPTLGFHRWITSGPKSQCEAANSTPCWGTLQPLSAAQGVTGQTNGGSVSDPVVGATLDPFTFGEASIDLQASGLFPEGTCITFTSAYLKSRSSDSFTSAIKDFIAPIPINLSNCSPVPLPNTAYARASNFVPQGGAANDWISDGGLITVQVAQSASSLVAPSRQHLAMDDAAGSATGLLASAGDKAIWIPTRRGPRVM